MALKNANNNYFKIGKVVGFNSVDTSLSVQVEEYENKDVRDNPTKYDKKVIHQVGVQLDAADVYSFVEKIYSKIKLQDEYSNMTDVLEK